MSSNAAIQIIEKQHWLDSLADTLQPAIQNCFASAGTAGQKIRDFLHGKWLGHPLHSALTDVPLGAWTVSIAFDAMDEISGREEFERAADAALTIGIAGAVGSAVTGLTDWHKTDGRARRIGITHGLMNASALALYVTSLALRKRGDRRVGRGFALAGFIVSSAAAYLGGHLAYGEQIGVDHTADQTLPNEFTPVMARADLKEGELHKVEVNSVPVLVVLNQGHVYAIAETCSHLGGPLAEGTLEDGSVRCPWHGSRFSLEDGRVLEGPSVHNQPCFEVRVRDGQIEIKAAND